jgi:hypothetical protein
MTLSTNIFDRTTGEVETSAASVPASIAENLPTQIIGR